MEREREERTIPRFIFRTSLSFGKRAREKVSAPPMTRQVFCFFLVKQIVRDMLYMISKLSVPIFISIKRNLNIKSLDYIKYLQLLH